MLGQNTMIISMTRKVFDNCKLFFVIVFVEMSLVAQLGERQMYSDFRDEIDYTRFHKSILNAQADLVQFLRIANAPRNEQKSFSLLVKTSEGNCRWLDSFSLMVRGETFESKASQADRSVEVNEADVIDWAYIDNGWLRGGWSIKAKLAAMEPEEREEFSANLAFCVGSEVRHSQSRKLMDAIGNRDAEMVQSLIAENPSVLNTRHIVAARVETSFTMKPVWAYPLQYAVRYSSEDIVELLIAEGARINVKDDYGASLLSLAAQFDRAEILRLLHSHGLQLGVGNRIGLTPLHVAVANGSLQSAEVLLELGADVNVVSSETQHSVAHGIGDDAKMVDLLVEYGLKLDRADKAGNTPLLFAAKNCFKDAFFAMLKYGANPNIANENGVTASDLADANGWSMNK